MALNLDGELVRRLFQDIAQNISKAATEIEGDLSLSILDTQEHAENVSLYRDCSNLWGFCALLQEKAENVEETGRWPMALDVDTIPSDYPALRDRLEYAVISVGSYFLDHGLNITGLSGPERRLHIMKARQDELTPPDVKALFIALRRELEGRPFLIPSEVAQHERETFESHYVLLCLCDELFGEVPAESSE